ncbi:MAG: hypothetical protein J6S49_06410 [Erysipelotrichaceae bacterium]|nr:hypothetical protein [Erysipelotrichaceae bacterium]MBO7698883.1 hypothetical protein [Erysipelotrichaceae bacterium]MBP5279069.1 hypothetical protein [Erysipelotrichaceae bacterium]
MLMLLFGFIGLMFDLALGAVYFLFKIVLSIFPIVFVIYILRSMLRDNY